MVPRGGIEPPTRGFQSPALPTEISRRYRYWLLPDNGAYLTIFSVFGQ